MKNIRLIILFVAALAAVFLGVWVVQDNDLVTGVVLFGFSLAELPVGLWILVFFFLGIMAGICLCYPTIFSLKRQRRRYIKRLQKLDAELGEVRAQSIPESVTGS